MAEVVSRVGETLKDKYRLEQLLGAGGMGEVYRAKNTLVDRIVAIKLLHVQHAKNQQIVERFMREAKAANVVRHKNIVDVLDIDRDDQGVLFIVQEYLEGEDLATALARRCGKMSASEALEIIIPVARAVGEAHRRGVVHRDLKPDNVFLAKSEGGIVPKVLDFGISMLPSSDASADHAALKSGAGGGGLRLTTAGAAMGTPVYMSPEQIRDPATVDARTDVWSLGVVLYEVLSGTMPFDAEDLASLFARICTQEPPALERLGAGVPRSLSQVVARCMRPDREARFPSATEVAMALERCRDGIELPRPSLGAADTDPPPPFPAPRAVPIARSGGGPAPAMEVEGEAPDLLAAAARDIPSRGLRMAPAHGRNAAARGRVQVRPRTGRADQSAAVLQATLAVALVLLVSVVVPYLPPSRVLVLEQRLALYTFVPYAAAGGLVLVGAMVVLWYAAREVSFLLLLASLSALAVGATTAVVGALLAAPGLVPDVVRKALLVSAPWSAAILVTALAVFGLLHSRDMKAAGTRGAGTVLALSLVAALAIVWLLRSPRASSTEVSNVRLVAVEEHAAAQAARFAAVLTGAAAIAPGQGATLVRSTWGSEKAASAVGERE